MPENDPFTQVLDKLWEFLEAYEPFASLVKLANRIKVQGSNRTPYKAEVQDSDLPEVIIVPAGGETHLFRTSDSSSAVQLFEIRGTTGDLRTDRLFFPLKWALIRGVARMGHDLGIESDVFKVTKVSVMEAADTQADEDANRGTQGWSCRLVLAVELWFQNATLIAD